MKRIFFSNDIFGWLFFQGEFKNKTMENLDKYVEKNPDLPLLLDKWVYFSGAYSFYKSLKLDYKVCAGE